MLDLQGRAVQGRTSVSAVQGQGGSSARSPPVDALQGRSFSARLLLRPCWRAARTARHVIHSAVVGEAVAQAFGIVVIHASPRFRALAVAVAAADQAPPAFDARCGARPTDRFAFATERDALRERVAQLVAPEQAQLVAGLRLALQDQLMRRRRHCSAAKLARSAACCAAQRSVLRFGLPTGYRLWIFDSIRSPLDPQRSSES